MSVEDKEKIDFVSIQKKSGDVILTISDHLPWNDERHLMILQDKINSYLEYIEGGQIQDQVPDAEDRNKVISVEFLYHPNALAVKFLGMVSEKLRSNDIGFRYRQSYFNASDSGRWKG